MSNHTPGFLDAQRAVGDPGKVTVLRFGRGLDLWVYPSGLKTWRCKVQRDGKRTTLNLGYFPRMSIDEAHDMRAKIRIGAKIGKLDRWRVGDVVFFSGRAGR
jgi:hypothetical protein